MLTKLAEYGVLIFGQEEDGPVTVEQLEYELNPHELATALTEFISGALDREISVFVTRTQEVETEADSE